MPAPHPSHKDPYRCEWCGARKVVPSLARDCENNHMTEDECRPEPCTAAPTAHG